MDLLRRAAVSGLSLALVLAFVGCASTKVTGTDTEMSPGEKLARPDRILVFDFGATAADVAADSSIADQVADSPQTPEQLELGRKLGAEVAQQLTNEIIAMGLPGELAREAAPPNPGDIAIKGYFGTIDQGSAVKRIMIGFGSGAAQLQTYVEDYLMTDTGLRRLGGEELRSGGGKSPGMLLPIAVTIATENPIGLAVGGALKAEQAITGSQKIGASAKRTAEAIGKELKVKFREQGWIE